MNCVLISLLSLLSLKLKDVGHRPTPGLIRPDNGIPLPKLGSSEWISVIFMAVAIFRREATVLFEEESGKVTRAEISDALCNLLNLDIGIGQ